MTANQIAFVNAQETQRHNLAMEQETARHQRAAEGIDYYAAGSGYAGVAEQRRHNQQQELINWYDYSNPESARQITARQQVRANQLRSEELEESKRRTNVGVAKDMVASGLRFIPFLMRS